MVSAPKRHRLGLLGLGEGRSILSAATQSAAWEVVQICDLNAELCRQRQVEFKLSSSTTSYPEMLANPAVEVVAVFTPDAYHAEHVKMALNAGKHVICTKPLFDSLRPAAEIASLLAASRRLLLVGMSCRFFETFRRQQADYVAGKLGTVLSAEAFYHGDKRQGTSGQWGKQGQANWLYTGLSHAADLVLWHLGPIAEVTGYGLTSPAGAALGQMNPDGFHFALRSEGGAIGTASGFYGTPQTHFDGQPMMGCILRGTAGTSVATYPRFDYYLNEDGKAASKYNFDEQAAYYFRFGGYSHHAGEFQNYLEYFGRCLDTMSDPCPGLWDGIHVLAVLTAMARVLQSGRPVQVQPILREYGLAPGPSFARQPGPA